MWIAVVFDTAMNREYDVEQECIWIYVNLTEDSMEIEYTVVKVTFTVAFFVEIFIGIGSLNEWMQNVTKFS